MSRALSLLAQKHELADPRAQTALLASLPVAPFPAEIRAGAVEILQMNVGKRCNQACAHCHVDAAPDRKEVMSDDVVDACLRVLERDRIATLDITGGAPELHPRFKSIVARARKSGASVIDRCNLTVLDDDLADFLAEHRVRVVASLPSFEAARTDAQRGDGVFDKSMRALARLNARGYGGALELTLVSNPTGAFLPAAEKVVEADFHKHLAGIAFTRLITLTNMPIARFLAWLDKSGNTERYVGKLAAAYNAAALPGLMCRNTLSVAWDGRLYDCDFNQMLELGFETAGTALPHATIQALAQAPAEVGGRRVATGVHCYGCTAGQGSSCGGALV